ncbi:MAG: radical SAM protein [Acidobacteriota bacterium]|nr:MAG: radical SAM protein [Acidobacteriota bacterium]
MSNIKETAEALRNHPDAAALAARYAKNLAHELRLVFWETTAGCNLECVHCRRLDVAKELMKTDLTTEESLRLVDSVREVGTPILVLSGGEPLFRPDIFDIASYACGKGLAVALATNGTLIDREMAKKISASGIQRVSISLDGTDEKTHDDFRRQPGSLKAALEGLRRVKEQGISIQVNTTVTKHNVHQLEEFYRLALEMGADSLHFFMLVPVGCGVQIAESNVLDAETYEEVLRWLYRKSMEKKLHCKAVCAPHYYRIMREEAKKEGRKITPQTHGMDALTKGCLAGTAVCFISHEGDVFPCGYLPVSCGNIRKQRFKDIWENSPVFAMLRNDDGLEGKCGICEFKKVCMGCRARAFYESGSFMDEEPYCIYVPRRQRASDVAQQRA